MSATVVTATAITATRGFCRRPGRAALNATGSFLFWSHLYRASSLRLKATDSARALQLDRCGVSFPRLTSEANAFEQPAASAISETLGRR